MGWLPIGASRQDLVPWRTYYVQQRAWRLYRDNPLAKRIVDLEADIVCGKGFEVTSPDEKLDGILKNHWQHPVNEWPKFLKRYVIEKSIWGEALMPVTVNPVNGLVLLGWVDPSNISGVKKCSELAKFDGKVMLKMDMDGKAKSLENIRYSLKTDRLEGDAFFFRRNSPIGATRGIPDLYPLIDWLEGHEKMLFDQMERVGLLNSFIWDVTLAGFDASEIADWAQKRTAPDPGTVRAHNESETWKAESPDLGAGDMTESEKQIKRHIVGGTGYPEHWFGATGEVTRSTAAEMGFSAVKTAESRQDSEVRDVVDVTKYVRQEAYMHRQITDMDAPINVMAPTISEDDQIKVAETFHTVVQALAIASINGWADDDTALNILSQVVTKFGIDADMQDIKARLNDVKASDLTAYKSAAEKAANMEAE